MGHTYVERTPRTQEWRGVVKLIRDGADVPTVAKSVTDAARGVLRPFASDPGVVEATWYLIRIPIAAQEDDFPVALRRLNLRAEDPLALMDLLGAVSDALDQAIRPGKRTDLGEMAQTALIETLADRFGVRTAGLFETGPSCLHAAIRRTATVKQFGQLAVAFFARLVRKSLDFFLSRELVNHVGPGRRFRTLESQEEFTKALCVYAEEAAAGVDKYAGEWFSNWEHLTEGTISRNQAGAFLAHAADKLTWALKVG